VPAVAKVRLTVVPELFPGMSAGAPGTASKKTLCATEPNEKVIVPPGAILAAAGSKAIAGVAATVADMGGGPDVIGVPVLEELPAHPVRRKKRLAANSCDVT
jgi:hypothetical protein